MCPWRNTMLYMNSMRRKSSAFRRKNYVNSSTSSEQHPQSNPSSVLGHTYWNGDVASCVLLFHRKSIPVYPKSDWYYATCLSHSRFQRSLWTTQISSFVQPFCQFPIYFNQKNYTYMYKSETEMGFLSQKWGIGYLGIGKTLWDR